MPDVVINRCFGGYGLSREAYKFLGLEWDGYGFAFGDDRTNPKLIWCVASLGARANGMCASLAVVSVPDDVEWEIDNYDGWESVEEKHRSWG